MAFVEYMSKHKRGSKSMKMKEGQCKTTRKGRKYCKRNGKVRFVKS